jgi:phospholipid N-methyltransferase
MLGSMKPPADTVRPLPTGWTFFRQWLKDPLRVAAISPSSRQLARQMMTQLPRPCRRVVELGGGTGVFTQALLDHGIAAPDMLVLELNEELHHHLVGMFPGAHVVCGDAGDLAAIAGSRGFCGDDAADAVISGLGLLSMPRQTQQAILAAAFATLRPTGRFIQFTYGPANPVTREVTEALDLVARRASFTWWNVPPATVYVYERRVSRTLSPRKMR